MDMAVCICGHLERERIPSARALVGCVCTNFQPDDKDKVPA